MRTLMAALFVLIPLTQSTAFSQAHGGTPAGEQSPERAVALTFDLIGGVPAANALAAWGVAFRGSGSEIVFRIREIFSGPIPQGPTTVLRNEGPDGGSSANLPLIIAFERPVRRLGLTLANGSESTRAELIGFNALGVEVARLSNVSVGSDDEGLGIPSTLEAPEGESIVTATVDYGAESRAEEIDDMLLTFEQAPRFRRCIAQFADGVLPNGGGSLRTVLVLTNSHNRSQVIRTSFFDNQGNPVDFPSGGNAAPPTQIQLRAFNSLTFPSSGASDPPVEGYACVEGDGPVAAFAVYQIFDGDASLVQEAGIDASPQRRVSLVPGQSGLPGGIDTGVAIANLSMSTAQVALTLTAGNGTQNRSVDPIELQPGEHRTFFLEEIFGPGLEVVDGTLVLRSDQPLAVTALRTRSGLPVASLPAASPEDANQYVP